MYLGLVVVIETVDLRCWMWKLELLHMRIELHMRLQLLYMRLDV